jgi:hypothetical protein
MIIFLLLLDICLFLVMGRPLWRKYGSVVYNCCWASPAQSFSGMSSTGLRSVTPWAWWVRSSYLHLPGSERPGYNLGHRVPDSSPLTIRRAVAELFDPPPRGFLFRVRSHGPCKQLLLVVVGSCLPSRCSRKVFTNPLPNSGRLLWVEQIFAAGFISTVILGFRRETLP